MVLPVMSSGRRFKPSCCTCTCVHDQGVIFPAGRRSYRCIMTHEQKRDQQFAPGDKQGSMEAVTMAHWRSGLKAVKHVVYCCFLCINEVQSYVPFVVVT